MSRKIENAVHEINNLEKYVLQLDVIPDIEKAIIIRKLNSIVIALLSEK